MKKVLTLIALSAASIIQASFDQYQSHFAPPTETAKKILYDGNILDPKEQPHEMVERVVTAITAIDHTLPFLTTMPSSGEFGHRLGELMDSKAIVFSTPILTNCGRLLHRPLSACVMPPVNLKGDLGTIKAMVDQYHQDGMGTGYNLSDLKDPIAILKDLNLIAVEGSKNKLEHRPVGNMAILDVDHPSIEEFIRVKVGADARDEDWKFNISVNITDAFMHAAEHDLEFTLKNDQKISARGLRNAIASAAHSCGDPGLISLDRLNEDNPTPHISEYKTTAPCAEVGLAPGETCVFGYINLGKCLTNDSHPSIDFNALQEYTTLMTRALDDVLEISINKYVFNESSSIMSAKRKIGIGVCGFADMLIILNIPYNTPQARTTLQEILSFISYHSKMASMALAKARGSFSGLEGSKFMNESFLLKKYGSLKTEHVSQQDWQNLAHDIKTQKLLRHSATIALPPTGRSAQIIGASTSIEPLFSLLSPDGIYPALEHYLKKNGLYTPERIDHIRKTGRYNGTDHPFITATEIPANDHIAIVADAQKAIDEAISKTINLPEDCTVENIERIYQNAYNAGLKGMTVYRNNCRTIQPKALSTEKN